MKRILFALAVLFSTSSLFAMSKAEMKERIQFIDKELATIQGRIDSGQDPALFKSYVDKFNAEKKDLQGKLGGSTRSAPRKVAPAPKNVTSTPVKNSNSRQLYISENVRKAKTLPELTSLLKDKKNELIDALATNNGQRRIRQNHLDVAFLEAKIAEMGRSPAMAADTESGTKFKYRGHFQFRQESATNRQGTLGSTQTDQAFFRLRTYLTFSPNNAMDFNLTPQATKSLGEDNNAGQISHQGIDYYEANFNYKINKSLQFKLGRQEVAYGDHLIIGSLPWANTARSFDALKFKYSGEKNWTDVMYAKVVDNGTQLDATDDTNMLVVYHSHDFGPKLKNADLYYIHRIDNNTAGSEVNTIGFRLKGAFGDYFYRTENGQQSGSSSVEDDAYQYNLELGKKFHKYKLSLEYATAGANYVQMYPTAHKFLGFADVLGRKNINHTALHLMGPIAAGFSFRLDYHQFQRNDTEQPAYNLLTNGNFGTTGTSADVGSEIDLVVTYKTKDKLKLQFGTTSFTPGTYMEDNGLDENVLFHYLQLNAGF